MASISLTAVIRSAVEIGRGVESRRNWGLAPALGIRPEAGWLVQAQ